ncbi:MAG: PIN/TRAM domain-containing protein [Eubacterium sp.]
MIRKFMRAVFAFVGAGLGYGITRLIQDAIRTFGGSHYLLSSGKLTAIAISVAIILGFIFFMIAPAVGRKGLRLSKNIGDDLQGVSSSTIISGTIGLIAALVIAFFLSQLFSFVLNRYVHALIVVVIYGVFCYLGIVVGTTKGTEIVSNMHAARKQTEAAIAGSASRGWGSRKKNSTAMPKILDTSVIIDGRIADIMGTGFLEGTIVIPEFVLIELRHIADSADSLKRARGRHGLDVLNEIQTKYGVEIYNTEKDKALTEIPEVDVKLLKLAQMMNGAVVTNDYNLNKVAGINKIKVLNINELANTLKPVVLPGEEMTLKIVKHGKDPSQGIGYLNDGTMIVVEDGVSMIGKTANIRVTSVLQTSAGKMIFGRLNKS